MKPGRGTYRGRATAFDISRRRCLKGLAGLSASIGSFSDVARAGKVAEIPDFATAVDLARGLRAGKWSAREVVEAFLDRITRLNGPFESFADNGHLNAFIRVFREQALADAALADRGSFAHPWAGVPVALKDIFDVRGLPATGGTPAFRAYRASEDCAVWKQWHAAGAVLLGETQSQRFLTGVTTPQTANPWNPGLIAGGSSGGSAAAVAAGLVPLALGSETDGSLIYPAACCGVTTLKPSYGLLSLEGVYPGLPSFDVIGPIARTAADCAWFMSTVAPRDRASEASGAGTWRWPDAFSAAGRSSGSPEAVGARSERPFEGLRFLVSSDERYSSLRTRAPASVDGRIRKAFDDFLGALEKLGARIVQVAIPQEIGRYGTFRAEQDARMGGLSAFEAIMTHDELTEHYPGLYRRLEGAAADDRAIAVRFYDGRDDRLENDDFLGRVRKATPRALEFARARREDLQRSWESLLSRHGCDAHVYLEIGCPLPARKGLEDTLPPDASREGVVACDLGWPVLSMPIGKPAGLDVPVSAQLMARRWQDDRLLAWGMEWQARHPETVPSPPGCRGQKRSSD
jgi:Asp-tRNA(Asn)/Glu-tRNA(Gln) amidotransferase A subunit family amidase